jgi:hypothetical protein
MKEDPKSEGTGVTGHERFTHPAYEMISVGQVSGNGILVGSSVQHGHFVSLEVSTAKRIKDNYSERWHADKVICRVHMSHAQLAEMLFSSSGSGVPCTLKIVPGEKGYISDPPFESPLKQNTDDLYAVLRETLSKAEEMAAEAEKLFSIKSPKKADKERAKFLALKIKQDIASNIKFAFQCVDEKTEKVVAHAKAEIESFVDMKFRAAGIEHLKEQSETLLIDREDA